MSDIDQGTRPVDDCAANAAPYVLGALPDEEHESFVVHLESCAICQEEVAALQRAGDTLPMAAPQLDAPPRLKLEIMESVREDVERQRRPGPARAARRSWLGRPAFALAGAAAAIILVVVVALSGGGSGGGSRVVRAQVLAPRASASVRLDGGHAELSIANMPQTEPGRVYEVWVQRGAKAEPTNALFTVTSTGSAMVGVPGSVAGAKAIMVTSEPVGGSRAPTRSPVIIANLS